MRNGYISHSCDPESKKVCRPVPSSDQNTSIILVDGLGSLTNAPCQDSTIVFSRISSYFTACFREHLIPKNTCPCTRSRISWTYAISYPATRQIILYTWQTIFCLSVRRFCPLFVYFGPCDAVAHYSCFSIELPLRLRARITKIRKPFVKE